MFVPSAAVPPKVTILRPREYDGDDDQDSEGALEEEGDEIRLNVGDELALVCRGTGDPEPRITWSRKVVLNSLRQSNVHDSL